MKIPHRTWFLLAALLPLAAPAASNLVVNGSFDAPGDPLKGWQKTYKADGESWYKDNEKLVAVVPSEGNRSQVLKLTCDTDQLAGWQGVKADSDPIPFTPGRHRFSAWARSTGPQCRIMLEGYRWRPDVKPHDKPTIYDLRKCYKFTQLYFGSEKGGDFGGVGKMWSKGEGFIPEDKLSDLGRKKFEEVQFVIVHVVAIGGKKGDLLVDSIELERIGNLGK